MTLLSLRKVEMTLIECYDAFLVKDDICVVLEFAAGELWDFLIKSKTLSAPSAYSRR